ncbi:DUF3043 domain-containing protein [Microlunatus soli]|uniref:DUF3043 domain-containing protein n=1 Tax=Microlunatus soli TaxID=630515 RepID=A0A1H1PS34_9ACTN|nr:DUF3043 domain-containing protein [Microlunatus soli]SDS13903.1 Protein of unknown function [Microlunatus soli]
MALFGRKNQAPQEEQASDPGLVTESGSGPRKKDAPTPTRKQAEAARRERLTKQVSKKDAARAQRAERMKAIQARDNTPEKALLRDYIDARRNIGEFLLPGLVVILGASFLYTLLPNITLVSTVLMYVFILVVLLDSFLMWRGFKKVLAQRLPKSSTRGLLFYGINRSIQIRRFRMPAPRIKRGEAY